MGQLFFHACFPEYVELNIISKIIFVANVIENRNVYDIVMTSKEMIQNQDK